jgi:hypothetical protein
MTKRGVESICMFVALLLATAITATAQERPEEASPDRARANFARTIAPADDDVRAFPAHWGSNLHHFAQRIFR